MLDLNNELNEEDEALKILNYALAIVGTDGLKHKINEDYKTLTANIKLKPIIQLLDNEDFIGAYKKIEELEKYDFEELEKDEKNSLKKLKKRSIFGRLGKGFIEGKNLFEKEKYTEALNNFTQIENLAKKNIDLFEGINPEGLNVLLNEIRSYLNKIDNGELDLRYVFDYIDNLRKNILEKLSEEDGYFFIFYIDSITYGYLSNGILIKNSCYFCNKEMKNDGYGYNVNMYKITSNFNIIIYSNKKFKRIAITIPRCKKCQEVMDKFSLFGLFKHEDSSRIINKDPYKYQVIKDLKKDGWKIGDGPD